MQYGNSRQYCSTNPQITLRILILPLTTFSALKRFETCARVHAEGCPVLVGHLDRALAAIRARLPPGTSCDDSAPRPGDLFLLPAKHNTFSQHKILLPARPGDQSLLPAKHSTFPNTRSCFQHVLVTYSFYLLNITDSPNTRSCFQHEPIQYIIFIHV